MTRIYTATIKQKIRIPDDADPFKILQGDIKVYVIEQEIVSVKEIKE